jgi:mRNA-degrading endonuclease RelE of RelBE toxin-antitoxin system
MLPSRDRAAVEAAIDHLTVEFGTLDVTKLGGSGNTWRLRVGRWRILLGLNNSTGEILVARVVDRKDAYRD